MKEVYELYVFVQNANPAMETLRTLMGWSGVVFSNRRRHTLFLPVSWATVCV